jgi:membrane protein implicated in regulation of membrane protease activity
LISLGIGAVGAVAADYFGYDLTVQIIVFIIVSIICIFLSFRISKRLNEDHDAIKSNQEGLIGKEGTVKEEIPKNEVGMVVVDGKDYVATSYENINENSQVKVIDNDDLMLIVEKK